MAKFLGVPTSGSQGATTWARNRYGQYTRMRAHPVNPNTPAQRQARSALSGCASAWQELTHRPTKLQAKKEEQRK